MEDVSPYPCITFEQGEHNGQFFFEGLSAVAAQSHKTICVRERATEYQLLRALNGFSPDVGVSAMYREEFVSLPLEPKQFHTIGYILRRDVTPSPMTLGTYRPCGGSVDIGCNYIQLSFSVFYKYQIYPYTEDNKAKQNKMLKGDLKL